ncbi:hypothetical protein B0H13DRAFT_2328940 [Mycena leptocephala]|nr:hypothetical protein B0H13DRAFT_2328940 [Mycena leptocephala]
MIFPSIAISFFALSLPVVHASPPAKGAVNTDLLPPSKINRGGEFAIPVKIVNLATNGTIFASNHSVLIGGAPAEYGDNSVWNRWQVNTDAWIFENRANEEMLQVRPDNGQLETGKGSAAIFVVKRVGSHYHLELKLPYGDAAWEAIPGDKDKGYGVVALKRGNGKSSQRWVYTT